jgi:hypothetical protein
VLSSIDAHIEYVLICRKFSIWRNDASVILQGYHLCICDDSPQSLDVVDRQTDRQTDELSDEVTEIPLQ